VFFWIGWEPLVRAELFPSAFSIHNDDEQCLAAKSYSQSVLYRGTF
jgi:hypothetical protein